MRVTNSLVSLIISMLTAVIVAVLLSLLDSVKLNEILITSLLTGFATFIITYIILELMVFRYVVTLRTYLSRIAGVEVHDSRNPIKRILQDLLMFNKTKETEIAEYKRLADFRKDFIADVSHELKTPIFAAQGFVHTLIDGAVKDKNVRDKFLKKAARSLDGLDLLIQDLMTLSHLEIGEIRMHFEYFDISILVKEVFEQFENRAAKKEIKLILNKPLKSESIVYADPQRINQVLNNLVSNAINYSDEGGEVMITIETSKSYVTTRIIDHGVGIPHKDFTKIFQRFYRVEKSRSRKQGGTGLGLAIVKHIIEQHKSTIRIKSVVDKGSEFSFNLPIGKLEPLFHSLVSTNEPKNKG